MLRILWLDVETVGLNGPIMRIQYAVDDGPIKFLDCPEWAGCGELLEVMANPSTLLVAYNAGFDVYHLYRWMHEYGYTRPLDSPDRPVKPSSCRVLDLQIPCLLHGPFKNFAFSKGKARSVARVRRIPRKAAEIVRSKVLASIQPHVPSEFKIVTGEHEVKGKPDQVTLSFSVEGRATLKAHARYYGAPTISLPDVWPLVDRELEKPWLPYYDPEVYEATKQKCLQIMSDPTSAFHTYCRLDIHFLRLVAAELMTKMGLTDIIQIVDHHSDCVHAVAYTRYHGFKVDRNILERTKTYYEKRVKQAEEALEGVDLKSSKQRLDKLRMVDPLVGSSKRAVLEVLAKSDRPSAAIAGAMLDFGKYRQRLLQVEKVLECSTGHAHPDLRVMGTATGRMAGTSGINWQGIAQAEKDEQGQLVGLRAALNIEWGGDFDALEVTIAAAAYEDAQLQQDLDEGVDLHSMSGSLIPSSIKKGLSYETIRSGYKNKDPNCTKIRKRGKSGVFSTLYGAQPQKISEVLDCGEEEAAQYQKNLFGRYQGIGEFRAKMQAKFCTADVDQWSEASVGRMERSITDKLGFTRNFDFEAEVSNALWMLGGKGIRTGLNGTVTRTAEKGPQTIDNAVKSALLGSSIAIQAAVWRQACNSPIQSVGANLTKILMAEIWNRLRVPMANCHDELLGTGSALDKLRAIEQEFLAKYRAIVKSLNIEIKQAERWSDK